MGRWVALVVAVVISAGLVVSQFLGRSVRAQADLPDSVLQDIDAVRKGVLEESDFGLALEPALGRLDQPVSRVLAYARASGENSRRLDDYLRNRVQTWTSKYPGEAPANYRAAFGPLNPDEVLAELYFLGQMAALRAPASPRADLAALRDAVLTYHQASEAHAQQHGARPELRKRLHTKSRYEIVIIYRGTDEFARICDQTLTGLYLADEPLKPAAAAAVVDEYWAWRKAT